jgi:hypothetical protein
MEYNPATAFTLTALSTAAPQRRVTLGADQTVMHVAAEELGGAYEFIRLAAANGLTDCIPVSGRLPRHLYGFTATAGMELVIPDGGL